MADLKMAQGDLKTTLNDYRGALQTLADLSAADTTNADDLRLVATGYRKVGGALEELGDKKGALENYAKAASVNESLMKADPDNVQAGMGMAISLRYTGDLLAKSGDRGGALVQYKKVLEILEKLSAVQPGDILVEGRRAEMLIYVAAILVREGKLKDARSMTSEALAITRKLAARSEATSDDLFEYAANFLDCTPADLREPATAVQYAKRAVEKSGGKDSAVVDLLARAYYANADPAHAVEAEEAALNLLKTGNQQAPPQVQREMESQLAKFRASLKIAQVRRDR